MKMEVVQIGQAALRGPDGNFMPAVPIYIEAACAGEINPTTGRTKREDLALGDVAKVFAENYKQYMRGTRKAVKQNEK